MTKKLIAITGPSGSGKTTLTENLLSYHDILIPTHTTTRARRLDDKAGFYRYLSCEQFESLKQNAQFLIYSGAKDRSYGVLREDCLEAWKTTDTILLNVSYKDVEALLKLPYDISLIALTFHNIELGVTTRLQNEDRNLSNIEIMARIKGALLDHANYFTLVKETAKSVIYTDEKNQEETLEEVEKVLKLHRPNQKIYRK